MADFTDNIFDRLLKHEGIYSNDEHDGGGRTIYGITEHADVDAFSRMYPLYKAGKLDECKAIAHDVYYRNYWLPCGADRINDEHIAEQTFDIAVNSGIRRGVKILQQAHNTMPHVTAIEVDGKFGAITEAAINGIADTVTLNNTMVELRLAFYKSIVSRNPTQKKFLRGWTNRANHFMMKANEKE